MQPVRPGPETAVGIDVAAVAQVHEACTPRIGEHHRAADVDERVVGASHDDGRESQFVEPHRREALGLGRHAGRIVDVGGRHEQGSANVKVGPADGKMRDQRAREAVGDQQGSGCAADLMGEPVDPGIEVRPLPIVLMDDARGGVLGEPPGLRVPGGLGPRTREGSASSCRLLRHRTEAGPRRAAQPTGRLSVAARRSPWNVARARGGAPNSLLNYGLKRKNVPQAIGPGQRHSAKRRSDRRRRQFAGESKAQVPPSRRSRRWWRRATGSTSARKKAKSGAADAR